MDHKVTIAPSTCYTSVLLMLVLVAGSWTHVSSAQPVPPLAHAHNDYEHSRPLIDALAHGFASIEVDVHLLNGTLFVAHDEEDIRPERTIENLYLAPLEERIRRNGGHVYPGGPPLLLLVDLKTEAESTYRALRRVLLRYSEIVTRFIGGRTFEGPVTVLVSGNRPWETMRRQTIRFAAYDGRPDDLVRYGSAPTSLIPLISSNWSDLSNWNGDGTMPEQARTQLRRLVASAHRQGRMLRFWGTADVPAVWRELRKEGVDLIGSDDLGALQRFLSDGE